MFNDRPANQNSGTKSQSSSNDYDECSNNSWENDNSEIESRIKNTANNTGIVPGIVLG